MINNTEFKKSNIAFDKVASNHNIACPQSDKEWINRRLNFFHMMFMTLRATMSQNQGFQGNPLVENSIIDDRYHLDSTKPIFEVKIILEILVEPRWVDPLLFS